MSDIEHLPVRPNINNTYQKSTKPRVPSDLKPSLLDDSRDPDIQKFINKKKTDTLEFESPPTKEEKQSKESEKPTKEEKGYSWVVIGLAVVIIILIIIVIYYVLKYNEVSHAGDLIPNSVVKPSPSILSSILGTGTGAPALVPMQAPISHEPTKKDLDSVLTRLSTIKEVDESKLSEVNSESESESELEIPVKPVAKPMPLKSAIKSQQTVTHKKIVEIVEDEDEDEDKNEDQDKDVIDAHESAFLLSENFDEDETLDPKLLEEIIDQANV